MKTASAALTLVLSCLLGGPLAAQEEPTAETVARIERLIDLLGSDAWSDREEATKALIELGEATTPFLLEVKEETDDYEIRQRISRILTATGGWAHDPEEVRSRVGQKLALFKAQEAWSSSQRNPERVYLQDGFFQIVEELKEMGTGIGPAIAAEALASEGADLVTYRANLAYLLGEIEAGDAAASLVRLLADEASEVRAAAAHALGKIDSGEHRQALRKSIGDEDELVRVRAVLALGEVREKEVVDWMIDLLAHEDPAVRQAAIFSLGQLTRQTHGFNAYYPDRRRNRSIERWRGWWEGERETFEFPSRPVRRRGDKSEPSTRAGVALRAVEVAPDREVIIDEEGPIAEPPAIEDVPEGPEDEDK